MLGGRVPECEDGRGHPAGRDCAVEVAGELASPEELFELGGDSEVRVAAVESWHPVEGGVKQQRVAAEELPADVEELAQSVGGRGGIEPSGVDGREAFRSRGFDEGDDEDVA